MARVLGRVEFDGEKADRYFIHCDTSGQSFGRLFADPAAAWRAYDEGRGNMAPNTAAVYPSRSIHVVRKLLAHSRSFAADGSVKSEPVFGIASDDTLLWPRAEYAHEARYSLLSAGGMLHFAQEVDVAFLGTIHEPICNARLNSDDGEHVGFDDVFGRKLNACPCCVDKLLG